MLEKKIPEKNDFYEFDCNFSFHIFTSKMVQFYPKKNHVHQLDSNSFILKHTDKLSLKA